VRRDCRLGLALLLLGGWAVADETLYINPSPPAAQAGQEITFQFSPSVRREGDAVTLDFGDGGSATVSYSIGCGMLGGCNEAKHTYAGTGTFTVTGSGTASGVKVAGSVQVTISAVAGDPHIWVCTAAHQPGYNQTVWRTDLEVHNPGSAKATFRISLLRRDTDNRQPQTMEYSLQGERSLHLPDVLLDPFGFEGAAALRITPVTGTLVVHSRTYNQVGAGSYGQFVPGVASAQAVQFGQEGRLIGLFHDPNPTRGFRTNLGLVNASPAPISVEVKFLSGLGTPLGTRTVELRTYEFVQLNKVFELITPERVSGGYLRLRTLTTGGAFLAYASMVDNITGDPVFIPAVVMPGAQP